MSTDSTLEAQVAADQADWEEGQQEAVTETPAEETKETAQPDTSSGLFDATDDDDPALALPKIDGQAVDKIRIAFTGTVELDRGSQADVALYKRLKFGKGPLTLSVEGVCKKTGGGMQATSKEGEGVEVVVGEKQIKVTSVYVPTPEEL